MLGALLVLSALSAVAGFGPLPVRLGGSALRARATTEGVPQPAARATAAAQLKQLALPLVALASLIGSQAIAADEKVAAVEEKVELGPPPADFGLKYDFYEDCVKVVNHMRYAVQMEKGNPSIADIATKTKDEMIEFVSYYRRFQNVSGRQSFSLLYTSINVLAGHYTSYGVKFPVPEKRRKRLLQEFKDIEKNIRKKR